VLAAFARSILFAARNEFDARLVTEPGLSSDPRLLYSETHYALAALLLNLVDPTDGSMLELAEQRLRLWSEGPIPLTFFNSMAVCLAAIVLRKSGRKHSGLQAILTELVARTPRRHREVAYRQYCGNNAYLQQVAVDTVMLPIARGERVDPSDVDHLIAEFRRYRTPEGFFYDLPRDGAEQERLQPPTYIMKTLFLAGVCHELHAHGELAEMFRAGMAAVLPLLTREGNFSYFGRTDNSPFAAGLTICNLRNAARLGSDRRQAYVAACTAAERFYRTFPRTPSGLLQCNRHAVAGSAVEQAYSRDDYAYVGQYSLASCAYALLGAHWFPAGIDVASMSDSVSVVGPAAARSTDLGVVKLAGEDYELCLRTGSQLTSWDRRYLGPTLLRYESGGKLLIGAIPRTVSTDERTSREARPSSRLRRAFRLLHRRMVKGIEQLDGVSVGFLPVLRRGTSDLLPYEILSLEVGRDRVASRYRMARLRARGLRPCLHELQELMHQNLPGLNPRYYIRPPFGMDARFELARSIHVTNEFCCIEDSLSGDMRGFTLLFSVRYFSNAAVRIEGLKRRESLKSWGSNGLQHLDTYELQASGSELRYRCHIAACTARARSGSLTSQPFASVSDASDASSIARSV
jgi:hypothetical protein